MQLRFDPVFPAAAAALGRFLSGSEWLYHLERTVDPSGVVGRRQPRYFFGAPPVDAVGDTILREEAEAL